jgi:hypothetical protein
MEEFGKLKKFTSPRAPYAKYLTHLEVNLSQRECFCCGVLVVGGIWPSTKQ